MKLGTLSRAVVGALVLTAGLAASTAPAAAVASNDNVANAISLTSGSPVVTNNSGATMEAGERQPSCLAAGDTTGSTLWYRVRATQPTTMILSTFGSKVDTTLAVYTGTTRLDRMTAVACNDDVEELGSLQSRIRFPAAANRAYLIQVGSLNGQVGRIKMSAVADPKPINDDIADATNITSTPATVSGDLTHATASPGEASCDSYYTLTKTVWYRYTPQDSGILAVKALSAAGSGSLTLYSSPDGALERVRCGSFYDSGSRYATQVQPGTTYYVQVAIRQNYDTASRFTLDFDLVPLPSNDDFDSPTPLVLGAPMTQSVEGATVEPGEPACGYADATVWFSFTPEKNGTFTVNTAGTDFYEYVGVYTVGPGGLGQLSCSSTPYLGSRPGGFPGRAGQQYFVQVGRDEYDYDTSSLTIAMNGATV